MSRARVSSARAYEPRFLVTAVTKQCRRVTQVACRFFQKHLDDAASIPALAPVSGRQTSIETAACAQATYQINLAMPDEIREGDSFKVRISPLVEGYVLPPPSRNRLDRRYFFIGWRHRERCMKRFEEKLGRKE